MRHLLKPILISLFVISLVYGVKTVVNSEMQLERTPEAQEKWEQLKQDTEDIQEDIQESTLAKEAAKDLEHTISLIQDFLGFRESGDSSYTSAYEEITGLTLDETEEETSGSTTTETSDTENSFIPGEIRTVNLVKVVDGDTIVVSDNGVEYKVRFIGIDTPESVNPDESKNTEYGSMASAHTKELLEGITTLYLELGEETTDSYGRVLAYIWLAEDTSDISNMLNAKILADGYADTLTISPNIKYAETFETIKNRAKESDTGLWQYQEYKDLFA